MSSDLEAKLAQLKKLHQMGLLTDADLQRQKDAALAAFMGTTPAAPASTLSGATELGPSLALSGSTSAAVATALRPTHGSPSATASNPLGA